jgi:hypothetical protein
MASVTAPAASWRDSPISSPRFCAPVPALAGIVSCKEKMAIVLIAPVFRRHEFG